MCIINVHSIHHRRVLPHQRDESLWHSSLRKSVCHNTYNIYGVLAYLLRLAGYCDEGEGRFTIDSGYFCAYSEKWYPVWLPSQFLLGTGIECRYPVGGQAWGNYVYDANGAPVQGDWVMFGYDTQVMDELITGVDNVNANLNPNEGIFNLAGQRLSKMQKGINIVGGKKVLVK